MQRKRVKLSISKIIYWLLLFDLIWGGTGRVIMIGPLSFRMVLLGLAIISEIFYYSRHPFTVGNNMKLWAVTILIFIINLMLSLIRNNSSFAIDEFTGYITIILIPFMIAMNREDEELGRKSVQFFYAMILLFAVFSIGLWVYAYTTGIGNYMNIRTVLDRYVYGSVSYIGAIPRLFLKSSIFLTVGLLLALKKTLSGEKSALAMIEMAVFVIAIIATFTASFYAFSVIVALTYIIHKMKQDGSLKIRTLLFILFAICIIGYILWKTSAVDILFSRFTGDYTFSYKTMQVDQILSSWLHNPILGAGFGNTLDINYGYTSSQGIYRFEVMWLQLLYHTGLIGFVAFVAYILSSVKRVMRCEKYLGDETYFIFGMGIVFFSLVSFTNPFMNNTIGLIAFAFISGAAEARLLQLRGA